MAKSKPSKGTKKAKGKDKNKKDVGQALDPAWLSRQIQTGLTAGKESKGLKALLEKKIPTLTKVDQAEVIRAAILSNNGNNLPAGSKLHHNVLQRLVHHRINLIRELPQPEGVQHFIDDKPVMTLTPLLLAMLELKSHAVAAIIASRKLKLDSPLPELADRQLGDLLADEMPLAFNFLIDNQVLPRDLNYWFNQLAVELSLRTSTEKITQCLVGIRELFEIPEKERLDKPYKITTAKQEAFAYHVHTLLKRLAKRNDFEALQILLHKDFYALYHHLAVDALSKALLLEVETSAALYFLLQGFMEFSTIYRRFELLQLYSDPVSQQRQSQLSEFNQKQVAAAKEKDLGRRIELLQPGSKHSTPTYTNKNGIAYLLEIFTSGKIEPGVIRSVKNKTVLHGIFLLIIMCNNIKAMRAILEVIDSLIEPIKEWQQHSPLTVFIKCQYFMACLRPGYKGIKMAKVVANAFMSKHMPTLQRDITLAQWSGNRELAGTLQHASKPLAVPDAYGKSILYYAEFFGNSGSVLLTSYTTLVTIQLINGLTGSIHNIAHASQSKLTAKKGPLQNLVQTLAPQLIPTQPEQSIPIQETRLYISLSQCVTLLAEPFFSRLNSFGVFGLPEKIYQRDPSALFHSNIRKRATAPPIFDIKYLLQAKMMQECEEDNLYDPTGFLVAKQHVFEVLLKLAKNLYTNENAAAFQLQENMMAALHCLSLAAELCMENNNYYRVATHLSEYFKQAKKFKWFKTHDFQRAFCNEAFYTLGHVKAKAFFGNTTEKNTALKLRLIEILPTLYEHARLIVITDDILTETTFAKYRLQLSYVISLMTIFSIEGGFDSQSLQDALWTLVSHPIITTALQGSFSDLETRLIIKVLEKFGLADRAQQEIVGVEKPTAAHNNDAGTWLEGAAVTPTRGTTKKKKKKKEAPTHVAEKESSAAPSSGDASQPIVDEAPAEPTPEPSSEPQTPPPEIHGGGTTPGSVLKRLRKRASKAQKVLANPTEALVKVVYSHTLAARASATRQATLQSRQRRAIAARSRRSMGFFDRQTELALTQVLPATVSLAEMLYANKAAGGLMLAFVRYMEVSAKTMKRHDYNDLRNLLAHSDLTKDTDFLENLFVFITSADPGSLDTTTLIALTADAKQCSTNWRNQDDKELRTGLHTHFQTLRTCTRPAPKANDTQAYWYQMLGIVTLINITLTECFNDHSQFTKERRKSSSLDAMFTAVHNARDPVAHELLPAEPSLDNIKAMRRMVRGAFEDLEDCITHIAHGNPKTLAREYSCTDLTLAFN